jgi:hypothetical protein
MTKDIVERLRIRPLDEMVGRTRLDIEAADEIESLRQQLAECQAQVKQAKREALLEAASRMRGPEAEFLEHMAKELE